MQKDNIVWFHFYEIFRVDKFIEIQNRLKGREEHGDLLLNSYTVWCDETVLEIVRTVQHWEYIINATELYS